MTVKNPLLLIFIVMAGLCTAQEVHLSKVEKVHDNTDRFLYRIDETRNAEYLGEVEIKGFSADDAAVFSEAYKKAKEIGANAWAWKPFEKIDGSIQDLDPAHYRLALYYLPKNGFSGQSGSIYLFASSENNQKIRVNGKDYTVSPRSYLQLKTNPGEVYTISTRKLLGSTIKIQPKQNGSNQYFQISSARIKSDDTGAGGLNLKSGDIIGLEKSYAEFLSIIYHQQKAE